MAQIDHTKPGQIQELEEVARNLRRDFNRREFDRHEDTGWESDIDEAARAISAVDAVRAQLSNTPLRTNGPWLPIEQADTSVYRIVDMFDMPRPITNSEEYWCRDSDGRVFRATWADDGKRAYWWDLDEESPVDPVEFMPHPLDPRFKIIA